ncbi:MAG TPA: RICIN domain-containing protein [Opitutaceae bacterium]
MNTIMLSLKRLARLLACVSGLLLLPMGVLAQVNPYKAPLYWNPYEYNYVTDGYIPESVWSANTDWFEANLKPHGYSMICIDGWGDDSNYNEHGYRTTHSSTWTHDYAWWSAELQSRGMTLGIYNNPLWINVGAANAGVLIKGTNIPLATLIEPTENALWFTWVQVNRPGAEEYVKGYVQYYADMGVKYLRVDFLSWFEDGFDKNLGTVGPNRPRADYEKALRWIREACDANGMFFSVVMPHLKNEAELERKYGHMIRINEDTATGGWARFNNFDRGIRHPWWSEWYNTFDGYAYWSYISGRRQLILDGDLIRLNTFANADEKQTAISLHLLAGGPVSVSDQYNTIGADLPYYQNAELLALNADGFAGAPLSNDPTNVNSQIWTGQLSNGSWIVGLFNREDTAQTRSVNYATHLGIAGKAATRNLWTGTNLGNKTSHSVSVPPHGVVVLKVTSNSTPVATPTISPAEGTYAGPQTVTLATATTGATLRYTTDGSTPTASSPAYSGPFVVSSSAIVKAKAFKSGVSTSQQAHASYTIPAALPFPWKQADVGAVPRSGWTSYSGGSFNNAGSGADIEGSADAFHYTYRQVRGDFTFTTKVFSLTDTDPWAKAGIMVRESLAAGSANALAAMTRANGATFQRRTTTGGSTTATVVSTVIGPTWVRLARTGTLIDASYSTDGVTWNSLGSTTLASLSAIAYVGFATTSHSTGSELCSGIFSYVGLTTATPNTYRVTARHSGKALDVAGASLENGALIQQWAYGSANDNQKWKIEPTTDGYFTFTALHSGKALDVVGGDTADDVPVHQWEPLAVASQAWDIAGTGDGYFVIKNKNSGKVLDVYGASMLDGAQVKQFTYTADPHQQWSIELN